MYRLYIQAEDEIRSKTRSERTSTAPGGKPIINVVIVWPVKQQQQPANFEDKKYYNREEHTYAWRLSPHQQSVGHSTTTTANQPKFIRLSCGQKVLNIIFTTTTTLEIPRHSYTIGEIFGVYPTFQQLGNDFINVQQQQGDINIYKNTYNIRELVVIIVQNSRPNVRELRISVVVEGFSNRPQPTLIGQWTTVINIDGYSLIVESI